MNVPRISYDLKCQEDCFWCPLDSRSERYARNFLVFFDIFYQVLSNILRIFHSFSFKQPSNSVNQMVGLFNYSDN